MLKGSPNQLCFFSINILAIAIISIIQKFNWLPNCWLYGIRIWFEMHVSFCHLSSDNNSIRACKTTHHFDLMNHLSSTNFYKLVWRSIPSSNFLFLYFYFAIEKRFSISSNSLPHPRGERRQPKAAAVARIRKINIHNCISGWRLIGNARDLSDGELLRVGQTSLN